MIEKIDTYTPISVSECDQLWREIVDKYERNLSRYFVKLPGEETCKKYQLIYLYKYQGCLVHKDVVSEFVAAHIEDSGKDQQVRHLGSAGFYVLNRAEQILGSDQVVPSGYNILVTLDHPKPTFMMAYVKRQSLLNPSDFSALKQAYGNCCASCGAKEGERHRVSGQKVQLQQGHINPRKALGPGNTIPQCQYCNQIIFKDYFVLDENGYPNKISNADYIMRSDKEIRKEMFELLKKKDKFK